jgi:glycosyltransferase involved in cell wall biosynthesis
MSRKNVPLVSCLCITHNDIDLLKRAVDCFFHQTYPNKELILTYTIDNKEASAFIDRLQDPRIIRNEIATISKISLGEKRNLSIEKSNGLYFCNWDDDDWYHNSRIEFQVNSLKQTGYPCSVLSNLLVYDTQTKKAFLSAERKAWEQTILCKKSLIDNDELRYGHLDQGEDSVLLHNLLERDLVQSVYNPGLYIYIYHGKNTWHREHWEQNIMRRGDELTLAQAEILGAILNGHYPNGVASQLLDNELAVS